MERSDFDLEQIDLGGGKSIILIRYPRKKLQGK